MKYSVLILTFNEEVNIGGCIDSVADHSDEIVVLDSFSTDGTEEICRARGVRFVQRAFDDFASQRNYGLHEVEYKYPYVLMLDADERIEEELAQEIQALPDDSNEIGIYRFRRKDFFEGRWLKRSSGYPTWFGRLVNPEAVRVEREVHEQYLTDLQTANLQGHVIHDSFNKGVSEWFRKQVRFSTMEARLLVREKQKIQLGKLFSSDPVERRAVIKKIVYSLPFRPVVVFTLLYFFRLGFLEGRRGFRFCMMRATYEYMIDCKERELRDGGDGKPS